jgi:hypothetical protein
MNRVAECPALHFSEIWSTYDAVGLLILALITKGGSGFSPPRLKKQEEYMAKWFWIMAAGFAALAIAV